MIYLASPYTHPEQSVREDRFNLVCRAASILMRRGEYVYSPIGATHPMSVNCLLPLTWDYWEQYDRWFIERCDYLVVLMIDGWQQSKGVTAELKIARELGKPIGYVTMEKLENGVGVINIAREAA